MNNHLELYHKILFIERPWLNDTTTDKKYEQLLHSLSKENFSQQPLYELNFIKPLTDKTKYYHTLLENEARAYINTIHFAVNNASTENEKKYHIHQALTRKLKDKLEDTEKIIKGNQLWFEKMIDRQDEQQQRDNAYIIQLLKYQLIRLYLEIQNTFTDYLKEEPLREEDIHSKYFSELQPEKSFITKAPDLNLPKLTNEIVIPVAKKELNVIKDDIREPKKGVLKYTEIIAKPERFALVEEKMFEENILNENYDFIKRKGNNEKIAALFHLMMKKGYFNKYSFSGGRKEIKDLQLRHFLNHRYRSNIDREIRNFRDPKLLDEYLDNNISIRLIIPS